MQGMALQVVREIPQLAPQIQPADTDDEDDTDDDENDYSIPPPKDRSDLRRSSTKKTHK